MTAAPALSLPAIMAPLGLSRDEDHRYSWSDGLTVRWPIPSVTSIIRVVDRSGPLVGWAKRVTAEAALDWRADLENWVTQFGRDAAKSMLTAKATAERDAAAGLGSRVHALADDVAHGRPVSIAPAEAPYLAAYQRFLVERRPRFLHSERMVCNLAEDYAGTCDWFAEIDGETWIGDNKTGKGVYAETALQLSAYANAEFIGQGGDPKRYRVPRTTKAAALHLKPDGTYKLIDFAIDGDTFAAFLAARRIYGWLNGQAKEVMK